MIALIAVRDGGLADIYEVGAGELYDVTPEQVVLDLSDPAGMDLAARWLAAHYGLDVGATAPSWTRSGDLGEWALWGRGPEWYYATDLADPAEALRAACLAAVGRVA